MTKLRELQEKLYVKQDAMARIFDQSRNHDGTFDFTKADAFEHLDSQKACLETIDQLEKELEDIANEVKTLEGIKAQEDRLQERLKSRRAIDMPMTHAQPSHGQAVQVKSLAELVREAWPRDKPLGSKDIWLDREFKHFEIKALMTTSAGFAPDSPRTSRVVEFVHRPLQITDLFPVATTDSPQFTYMEETTSTNAAAETAEAALFPESSLVWTERTINIRKIATYIPVTDEQLADVAQVAGIIDSRLRFFVQQRLDAQLLLGNGVAPNILGLLGAGIQAHPKGADTTVDALYKGINKSRVIGRATPTAVLVHPDNWSPVRLMKTTDGIYIWGNPADAGPMRMFGLPVIEADIVPLGTAIVGDFVNMAQLWMRQGVEVLAGFVNDDFIHGKQVIRATLRAGLAVYRPNAFVAVTGLTA